MQWIVAGSPVGIFTMFAGQAHFDSAQLPLVHCSLPAHPFARPHFLHALEPDPPQSTSVSGPFITPSKQVGGWQ